MARPVILLILIAVLVRGSMLVFAFGQLADDPDAYDAIARTLATTGTFAVVASGDQTAPTAFRPPLYPALLAVIQRGIIATRSDLQDPLVSGRTPVSRPAIAVLHGLMSIATVMATYFVALRLLRSAAPTAPASSPPDSTIVRNAAFFSALLVIVDPILVQASLRVMTETLAALLAIGVLASWGRLVDLVQPAADNHHRAGRSLAAVALAAAQLGVMLGLAYLCRPTFIVWTALLGGYLFLLVVWGRYQAWTKRRSDVDIGSIMTALATLVVVAGVFVAGWTARNYRHFGKPIWATTHGGYTLLLANNPSFFQYMRTGAIGIAWDPQPFFDRWDQRDQADPRVSEFWQSESPPATDPKWQAALRGETQPHELFDDRLAYETARMAIANDRQAFVWSIPWRISRLLSPMPQVFEHEGLGKRIAAAIVTLFYAVTTILAVIGLFMLGRRLLYPEWFAIVSLVASLVVVHAFYWSNMRMRAPAIPALAIIAGLPLSRFLRPTATNARRDLATNAD